MVVTSNTYNDSLSLRARIVTTCHFVPKILTIKEWVHFFGPLCIYIYTFGLIQKMRQFLLIDCLPPITLRREAHPNGYSPETQPSEVVGGYLRTSHNLLVSPVGEHMLILWTYNACIQIRSVVQRFSNLYASQFISNIAQMTIWTATWRKLTQCVAVDCNLMPLNTWLAALFLVWKCSVIVIYWKECSCMNSMWKIKTKLWYKFQDVTVPNRKTIYKTVNKFRQDSHWAKRTK
jgi:hypothetical protein